MNTAATSASETAAAKSGKRSRPVDTTVRTSTPHVQVQKLAETPKKRPPTCNTEAMPAAKKLRYSTSQPCTKVADAIGSFRGMPPAGTNAAPVPLTSKPRPTMPKAKPGRITTLRQKQGNTAAMRCNSKKPPVLQAFDIFAADPLPSSQPSGRRAPTKPASLPHPEAGTSSGQKVNSSNHSAATTAIPSQGKYSSNRSSRVPSCTGSAKHPIQQSSAGPNADNTKSSLLAGQTNAAPAKRNVLALGADDSIRLAMQHAKPQASSKATNAQIAPAACQPVVHHEQRPTRPISGHSNSTMPQQHPRPDMAAVQQPVKQLPRPIPRPVAHHQQVPCSRPAPAGRKSTLVQYHATAPPAPFRQRPKQLPRPIPRPAAFPVRMALTSGTGPSFRLLLLHSLLLLQLGIRGCSPGAIPAFARRVRNLNTHSAVLSRKHCKIFILLGLSVPAFMS